jgi:hypothetical protein
MPEENTEQTEEEALGPFSNLDLKQITVFGRGNNFKDVAGKKTGETAGPDWAELAEQSKTVGWKKIDKESLERSLTEDVEACYFRLVSFNVVDLDDDTVWHASFLNSKGLWDLEIANSPKADVEPQQMADFFSSEEFLKIAKKAGWILEGARHLLEDVIEPKLSTGDLLEVDEIKLAAIYSWIKDPNLMNNLRSGKFMSI